MPRPKPFYYEDYDTKSDPEWLYHKSEVDAEFKRLDAIISDLQKKLDILGGDD